MECGLPVAVLLCEAESGVHGGNDGKMRVYWERNEEEEEERVRERVCVCVWKEGYGGGRKDGE